MRILPIVFLLSLCGCLQALSLAISDILEIAKPSKDLVIDLVETFNSLGEDVRLSPIEGLFEVIKGFQNKIDMLAQMEVIEPRISDTVIAIGMQLNNMGWPLLNSDVVVLGAHLNRIKEQYEYMGTYIEKKAAYEDLGDLEEYARSMASHGNNPIQSILESNFAIIAPSHGVPNIFQLLIDTTRLPGTRMRCLTRTSPQQLLFNLYNKLVLAELRGLLLTEFAYMVLKLHNKGNFTQEIEAGRERYKDRSAITLKLAIEAVKSLSTEFWTCGVSRLWRSEPYIKITEFLQGYIENEKYLNEQNSCHKTCEDYQSTRSYHGSQDQFCEKQRRCNGEIINCHFIADAKVCLADAGTKRRYEYIDQAGKVLGTLKDCGDNVTRFDRWVHNNDSCDYCMCLCDEKGVNSDRYFSMRPTESDIDHNKVVTGLHFVKKNRIIHLQIQQGKLLPFAKIDEATVDWKPVQDFRIDDSGVTDGQDYHTLTRKKRKFDLDDLVAKDDELLTGVRFRMIDSHLNFQIRVTPFNLKTGTLDVEKSKWKYSAVSEKNREKLNLKSKDIPRIRPARFPIAKSGTYLEFTPTDLATDVAQDTMPYIDGMFVALSKPVPLRGAGVLCKGRTSPNFFGYIHPKIMTYDYSKLLLNADDDINFGHIVLNKK